MSAQGAAEAATEAATEAVKQVSKPIGFFVALGAGALVMAWVIRRWGSSLPLPAYLVEWASGDDEDQADEEDVPDDAE